MYSRSKNEKNPVRKDIETVSAREQRGTGPGVTQKPSPLFTGLDLFLGRRCVGVDLRGTAHTHWGGIGSGLPSHTKVTYSVRFRETFENTENTLEVYTIVSFEFGSQ